MTKGGRPNRDPGHTHHSRDDGTINQRVYRKLKATQTDQYLSIKSQQLLQHKLGIKRG